MLDAADIIAEAEARIGIRDPETHLHAHLRQLVAALNDDAPLSASGAASARRALVDRTANRLEGLKWLRDYPEIGREPITAPVFLTGLPRSGTTFFQYLFDRDTRFRLIRTWEGLTPFPPPGADPESVTRRKAEEQARRQAMRPKVEGFEAMHLHDVDGPEECHAFLEQSYAAAGFHNLFNVPSYFDALLRELDLGAAYQTHKRQLQLLQWRCPSRRWALKYPNHVLAIDKIVEIHPDARFVMTHRDPVQTLASIAKLTCALRGARYEGAIDPTAVGRQMLHFVRQHIDRILRFCDSPLGARITHVDYYRLIDNPVKVMAEVHASLDLDTPPSVQAAVDDWHRRNPKGARGANPYALETYGLDANAVAELFGDYMRRFDIPRERDGLRRVA